MPTPTPPPSSSPRRGKPAPAALEPAKPGKRISIREIARRAGVSTATVSMVLNDNPKITEATRKKVRAVIDHVGYQPNRIAQSLSSKYTRVLGILLPTLRHALADPYFGELISGICDRAARLVIHGGNNAKRWYCISGRCRPREKGGVLVCLAAVCHSRAHNRSRRTGHGGLIKRRNDAAAGIG